MSAEPTLGNVVDEARRLPTGTVTFLFTDIEGSTRLLQALGGAYADLLADHDRLLDEVIARHGGRVFGHEGDAIFSVFEDAGSALLAALDGQRALAAHAWPAGAHLSVRMGIHSGEPIASGASYVGLPLHQVARVAGAANGGQIVVSETARSLAVDHLPGGVELHDLGEYRLKDLPRAERLYELVATDHPPHPAALRTVSARPNNLPIQLTSFVGRAEIEAAGALLAQPDTRLLTLTGPGGTGKTRLALQLAREAMDEFPDGTFFVELDAVDDPELVPSTVAHAIGVVAGADPPLDRLARHLADKRTLLVLDNFEQVAAAAPVVSRLLRDAPNVKIVVTSRIVLRAYGEQEFPVPPLARDEAIRLFVERAKAADPAFGLDDAGLDAVGEIVTRLDFLPLAIELAAARVRVLPVEALRARLDKALTVLTGGARDLPERQQTLRGAIDWSYDLLGEPDRRLFERFAVFAGGGGLSQIEAICGPASELGGDVLDGLGSLVEKSLLRSVPGTGLDPRFAMLATIREYAAERLAARGDEPVVRDRHAREYLAIVEACAPDLTGSRAPGRLELLDREIDNIRAAIDAAIAAGDADAAFRFGAGLWRFWQVRGHLHEALDRVRRILAMPGAAGLPPGLRARMLGAAGSLAYWSGDQEGTANYYRLALEAARESADARLIAEATYNAGFEVGGSGGRRQRFAFGRPSFEESLRLYRELGDEIGVANATWALGISTLAARDREAARVYLEESLELHRRAGNRFGEGWALHMIGLIDLEEDRWRDAAVRFRDSLLLFRETEDRSASVLLLLDFALVAKQRGHTEQFWLLGGAQDALSRKTGIMLGSSIEDFVDMSAPARPVDDPAGQRAWDAGALLTEDEAVALALEQVPDDA